MQDKEFLGTAPVGRLLAKLAIPTVLAQLVNMLYNIVDRIYIGRMPLDGDLALTGVGLCMPIILIVAAFAALVGKRYGRHYNECTWKAAPARRQSARPPSSSPAFPLRRSGGCR